MENIKKYLVSFLALLLGAIGGVAITATLTAGTNENGDIEINASFNMELADDQSLPAEIETEEGTIEVVQAPVVESVETNLPVVCPDGEDECGMGTFYYAPTGTPQAFSDYTLGGCWNTDNAYGGQCWDLGDLYWQNYAGRRLNTCGTGAAKGTWNCKEQNAGNEFSLVYNALDLQAGDWVIFGNGTYGHIGMALGGYNNGYVALLGQNQGGKSCVGGGSSANIININLSNFVGAFRPKAYEQPEPEPEPAETCDRIEVKAGDTLGAIMKRCLGYVEYGEAMNAYAKSWHSTKYAVYETVYDGWNSANGVGLFAGDVIERW